MGLRTSPAIRVPGDCVQVCLSPSAVCPSLLEFLKNPCDRRTNPTEILLVVRDGRWLRFAAVRVVTCPRRGIMFFRMHACVARPRFGEDAACVGATARSCMRICECM